jgi:hypothetical protein
MQVIDVPAETLICGDVVDESDQLGVLTLIQNLGLRVVSMNHIPDWSGWKGRGDTARSRTSSGVGTDQSPGRE